MKQILRFKLLLIASTLLALIISSCTTAYIPTELNNPAFHEENQFRGGLSYGASGANLQLGYSLYKNLGITADVSYLKTFGSTPEFQRNWGLALGYFTPLHKDKSVYMEVFTGFHISETRSAYKDNEFTAGPGHENSQYYKLYIQPDISFPFGFIELIFVMRINYMNFTKYEIHTHPNPELPRAFGVEPAVTLRMGSEYVQLKYQLGASLTSILSGSTFNYDKIFMHIGLGVSF